MSAACQIPPPGWWCSRVAGHDGPCAARPSRPDVSPAQALGSERILSQGLARIAQALGFDTDKAPTGDLIALCVAAIGELQHSIRAKDEKLRDLRAELSAVMQQRDSVRIGGYCYACAYAYEGNECLRCAEQERGRIAMLREARTT